MKRIFSTLAVIGLLTLLSCSKSSDSSSSTNTSTTTTTTTTEVNSFNLTYNGTNYTGTSVTYTPNPDASSPNYKNVTTASNNAMSIAVSNAPETGSGALCVVTLANPSCSVSNGDRGITLNINGSSLFDFSGTIERVSAKKIKINATTSGKALTGTIEWK